MKSTLLFIFLLIIPASRLSATLDERIAQSQDRIFNLISPVKSKVVETNDQIMSSEIDFKLCGDECLAMENTCDSGGSSECGCMCFSGTGSNNQ